jgi:hypothetical protein
MANESYSELGINNNLINLQGYLGADNNDFRLTNKGISSWSFDGTIPTKMEYVDLWNKELGEFNVKPGQYILLTDDVNSPIARPILRVRIEEDKRFYNKTITSSVDGLNANPSIQITNAVGNGTEVTYTANNDIYINDRVTITGMVPSSYNVEDALVTAVTGTTFKIAKTTTGTYSSGGMAEIVASFTAKVYVDYLDENFIENTKEFFPVRDVDGYPIETIYLVYEDWEERNLGSDGWTISSSGNAIFNNLAVRGEINATSGNFDGFLTVNNGSMKIGSNVNSAKHASIQSFQIASNKVVLTTTENHNFLLGESIVVEGIDSISAMSPTFPTSNLTVTGVSGNGTQITYTCANSLVAGSIVNITGVSPSSYNLEQVEVISATSTSFNVAGTTQTTYVSGGSVEVTSIPSNGVDINGTYFVSNITANTISYIFTANNSGPFTILNGVVSSGVLNNGIFINDNNYWYEDGNFKVGDYDAGVSWNPDLNILNVTGRITGSSIRASDVYADSAQLGGSEFGWVSGNGGIFSGTDQSTAYLQSGFYANPILDIEQELLDGLVKEYDLSVTGKTISASPRSLFATFSDDISGIKKGYQIYTGSGNSRLLVGIVDEVINLKTVKLRSVASRFIVNESFSIKYVKSTITSQFFAGFSDETKISIESPEGTEYDISAIDFTAGSLDNETITYQIPPVWTNIYEKNPVSYKFKSAFLTESSGEVNNIEINIQSFYSEKSTIDGVDYYDAKITVKASDIYVGGELLLDIGQNIFIGNIPKDSEFFYPLTNSYFPIIDIVENGSNYEITLYADGYLSFTTSSKSDSFTEYSINKFNCVDNKITLTTTANHRFSVGQVVNLSYVKTPYLDDSWSLEPRVITEVTADTFSFQYVFENKQNLAVSSSTTKASSFPTITKKSYDRDYSVWIGANNPTDAPFSIDTFGQNVKIKNLEVTGTVTGLYYDIIELDDFSGAFDGRKVTFKPKYNYKEVVIDNPLKLVLSVNGVLQSAFIKNREYVWQTGFLGFRGYTVDEYGQIKFSESPPPGSTVNARVFPGPQKNKTSRIYPFKAVDVALG